MTTTTIVAGDLSSGVVTTGGNDGTLILQTGPAGAKVNALTISAAGDVAVTAATGSLGYGTGSGGTVTQTTSRATAVTINKLSGAITLVTAAGSATWGQFVVNNSLVAATDTVVISGKSGASNYYVFQVAYISAGSFTVSFAALQGTASDTPVINFVVIKGSVT